MTGLIQTLGNGANAAISLGVPAIIANQGLPMIVLGTTTYNNNGAATLGTALASVPAITNCVVYVPTHSISSSVPAAPTWYYATFSSTTAVTIYNNVYTSGTPVFPASPTAFVTTGAGSVAGVSTAVTAYNVSIPGNIIGLNGGLDVRASFSYTNSGSTKTTAITYGALTLFSGNHTTTAAQQGVWGFVNAGATGVQLLNTANNQAPYGETTSATGSGTVDTTSAQTLSVVLTNATPASNNLMVCNTAVILNPSVA